MKITIAEASKLTEKSVPTLHRHSNNGKFSYSKNEKGEKVVDISELERCYGTLKTLESDNQENADQVSLRERDYLILQQENDNQKKENDNLKSQLRDAVEREQKLFDLTDRLTKQNEVLMLPKPKKTFTDIINFFRTSTPTKESR